MNLLNTELLLPCGAVLKNRIAKSAMSENMGTKSHFSNFKFANLYSRWARGGTGLLITGNVMIDHNALGEPANVVIEKGIDDPNLIQWAKAGTESDTHLWVQLNHPGKQSPSFLSAKPVAPSAIPLAPPLDRFFKTPRALTETEIQDIIERFGYAASVAKHAGFTGVQIHGAHGYLVSQFLSPRHNQRSDHWGGSIENRMRFALEVYRSIRKSVGPKFPVGIKLNSADFQKGGFTSEESMQVVQCLSEQGMDLIEVSGGTYETPEMTGKNRAESTIKREAYFLEYCENLRKIVKSPLMLTGGFRTLRGMESALESGACDVVGLARSLAINPEFAIQLLKGEPCKSEVEFLTTGFKKLDRLLPLEITWYTEQLHRIGRGLDPKPNLNVKLSVLKMLLNLGLQGLKKVRA